MPALQDALHSIAAARRQDPLAPVTVIAPSHVASISARRRLAEIGAFAGVRFETLPRLAELLGAAELAARGRSPLARPIADYLTSELARQAGPPLDGVAMLPGFARLLRQTFRRLRRGGIRNPGDVGFPSTGALAEVLRLYGLFRAQTSAFYDEEDLLEAAAEAVERGQAPGELGAVYVVPPSALSAGAQRFLEALQRTATAYVELEDASAVAAASFVLAPDPASEAREVVREVIRLLQDGAGLHEIAVLHGSDRAYRGLLSQAFASAGIDCTPMPGTPLSETLAGRAVLAMAALPAEDYARSLAFDFLGLAPLRFQLPAADGLVNVLPSTWQRLARVAGVTHGIERWRGNLRALIAEREADLRTPDELSDGRRGRFESELAQARELSSFMEGLLQRLEPLRQQQPALSFIPRFRQTVSEYLRDDAEGMREVIEQVEQLGTIDAVGGSFSLESFVVSLRANLEAAFLRQSSLGQGVLAADYRIAAGLSFPHVILCGAYEGVFPAGAGSEALIDDETWTRLRRTHPFIEDRERRLQLSREAAERARAAATHSIVYTAPIADATGGRDYYPSQLMAGAARQRDDSIAGAAELRRLPERPWLRRPASPLASQLSGAVLDLSELRLRPTLLARREHRPLAAQHPLSGGLALLRSRRSPSFSEYDGNLAGLSEEELAPRSSVSPTRLEKYAVCGFSYLLESVLRLSELEEPEEQETIDAAQRGTLVHDTLDRFFKQRQAQARPQPFEAWDADDEALLLAYFDEAWQAARRAGRTGLEVYAQHDYRALRADLIEFLRQDTLFRRQTGAVPSQFEVAIPETEVAGFRLRGFADRIDRTPDGSQAWVIDYKTGRSDGYNGIGEPANPLLDGKKLQLPVYLLAAPDVQKAEALYWFISARGKFEQRSYAPSEPNDARFQATLGAILGGLRQGAFPAIPGDENEYYGSFENCRYCAFDRVCSRRRDREAGEKQDDDELQAWSNVGRVARGELP